MSRPEAGDRPPSAFSSLVDVINDPQGQMSRILFQVGARQTRSRFVLCLGGTRTSDVPGVSAAGTTPQSRRLTPALDAELLVLGRLADTSEIPRSPTGVVSPVIITRACLKLLGWPVSVVDCGVFRQPKVDAIRVGDAVANCLSTGAAQPRARVDELFKAGLALGGRLAHDSDYLVVAECVPGGTTTALGVLTLLGYETTGLVSSSIPDCNHALRNELVESGLKLLAKKGSPNIGKDPLEALAVMGDPMQPVVTGIAVAASSRVPVILAGGAQMLAIHAVLKALKRSAPSDYGGLSVGICTTKWVARDKNAGTEKLSQLVEAPVACSRLDFLLSRHEGLNAYEQGHVKEGCGAGAAMLLTALSGSFSEDQIMSAIDKEYDELVGSCHVPV